MTQEPFGPDQVAELEKQLAGAAAEVARLQAHLAQAEHAGDPPPPSGAPLSTTPPAPTTPTVPTAPTAAPPYGGPVTPAGVPHVVINGQEITPGTGGLFQTLQALSRATAGSGTPVITVNGQDVSTGMDPQQLAAYHAAMSPATVQQLHDSLARLGLDHGIGAWFGHQVAPIGPPPSPLTVAVLAEPPRHVPFTFRLATFDLNVWEVFALVVGGVAGSYVWATVDVSRPIALVAACLVIGALRVRKYVRRIPLLRWGKVATVLSGQPTSQGTYASGTTVRNVAMRQASGWDVTARLYSGPTSETTVSYSLDSYNGSLVVTGLPYTNGVVLADSRKPQRAAVVSAFPYSVKPDESGQYVGTLSAWRWGGVIATLVIEATLVYVTVVAVLDYLS